MADDPAIGQEHGRVGPRMKRRPHVAAIEAKLLRFAEEQLRGDGVHVIGLHSKDAHNIGPLAARLGFERVETNWLKWIGG